MSLSSRSSRHSQAPGSAPSTRAERLVGGLRLFNESDRTDVTPPPQSGVTPETPTFRAVAAAINLGLSMLETPLGTARLIDIGRAVLRGHRQFDNIYEDRPENMGWWVGLFLARLRSSFPTVVMTNHIGGEGQVQRANWARDGSRMRQWDPSLAGVLRLNKIIIENMVHAGNNATQTRSQPEMEAFETFMFLMGVTVAHEMLHLFIGFLVGYITPSTPPTITFLPELYNSVLADGSEVGESGRAWEGLVFGGTVDAFESRSSPLGTRQSGILYVIDGNQRARLLHHGCVRRSLDFSKLFLSCALVHVHADLLKDFDFPLQVTGPTMRLTQLDAQRRTMKQVRSSVLPPALRPSQNRASATVGLGEIQRYRQRHAYTYQGRPFENLRTIPLRPASLFASA
ncbi:conserved hypothetical protein [Verticillium alfalfae VaMs.102]|uniref:Uncharacterized protein n=1 Tax=Verticillium alfalfae (strain VaMs.102 / ATCC MYA-4576 / FGSC 10136) TaxID=526221 RepID=C9ST32_VERA1|nr:conserved hypothetical protein [Verticillium alfalfae VaMs.102]EEY21947.1 conserved hypothetical protein [Verticillium alfalfae VaMs.102]